MALLGDKLSPSCVPGEETKLVALGSDEQGLLALPLPATKQIACQASFHWLDYSTERINKDLLHVAVLQQGSTDVAIICREVVWIRSLPSWVVINGQPSL